MTKLSIHVRHAISVSGLLSILLAGPASAASEAVLFSFGKGFDGKFPEAGLIDVGGTLYGTTSAGGGHNLGTVFQITRGGVEKVLHAFGAGKDGAAPQAGLIAISGALYGTTYKGGANGSGTIFRITLAGGETVLHSFGAANDGNMYRRHRLEVSDRRFCHDRKSGFG